MITTFKLVDYDLAMVHDVIKVHGWHLTDSVTRRGYQATLWSKGHDLGYLYIGWNGYNFLTSEKPIVQESEVENLEFEFEALVSTETC